MPQSHLEVDYVWKVSRYLAIALSSTQSPYIWILEVCTSLYWVLFLGEYEVMILRLISNVLFVLPGFTVGNTIDWRKVGLVYKPNLWISSYVTLGESFNPTDSPSTLENSSWYNIQLDKFPLNGKYISHINFLLNPKHSDAWLNGWIGYKAQTLYFKLISRKKIHLNYKFKYDFQVVARN